MHHVKPSTLSHLILLKIQGGFHAYFIGQETEAHEQSYQLEATRVQSGEVRIQSQDCLT